jgi:hypothetical protein
VGTRRDTRWQAFGQTVGVDWPMEKQCVPPRHQDVLSLHTVRSLARLLPVSAMNE